MRWLDEVVGWDGLMRWINEMVGWDERLDGMKV